MLANGQFESVGAQNAAAEFGSRPRVLAQSAIPFILAGGTAGAGTNQFTAGAAGAISNLPSLPTTYSGGAWLYLPAGTYAGQASAGWYWFVASGLTAGTVYNNRYTSGDPRLAVPTSLTAFGAGVGLVTQTTGEFTAMQMTLPANSLGLNGSIYCEASGSAINNANAKGGRIRLAGVYFGYVDITSNLGFTLTARLTNRNNSSSNIHYVNSGVVGGQGQQNAAPSYAGINTATDQTLDFRASIAAATDFVVIERTLSVVSYAP